jgi:thiamine-monophosphate kinase
MNEFERINTFFNAHYPKRDDVILGIGDDAAICRVDAQRQLVVSVDTLVAGVHFPEETPVVAIGYKALAVNLSDLAAMGATPAWMTLALTCPHDDPKWWAEFTQGLALLAEEAQVSLIGGDTTRGTLTITIQIMGTVPAGCGLRRSGAQVGDGIYVTGTLGDAGLGLAIVQNRHVLSEEKHRNYLISRLFYPSPRWQAGQLLLDIASSAVDISDGLAADLGHILTASDVGASLQLENLPLSLALRQSIELSAAYRLALTAGDDYELCFTVPEALSPLLPNLLPPTLRCTRIGTIEAEKGLRCIDAQGKLFTLNQTGYQHF